MAWPLLHGRAVVVRLARPGYCGGTAKIRKRSGGPGRPRKLRDSWTSSRRPLGACAASFTNQTLAQIELWTDVQRKTGKYKNSVYTLPKQLDEKVARLHLGKIGATLTRMSEKQAAYVGYPVEGPYKPEHYRY